MSSEFEKFQQLAQKIDPQSKLLRGWPLTGGISAQVTALEIERADGQTQKMIVRRHGDVDFQRNPHIAADEFKLLQILKGAGVAVPAPLYLDESGEIFDRPVVVIEFIDGKTEFEPANQDDYILQLATHLARIHRVDKGVLDFLAPQKKFAGIEWPENLDESIDKERIQEILATLPQRNKTALLHGDFWPGNILWRDGQLAAVIDWEDAALGDPLADVANARLEILWAFGIDAVENFTRWYHEVNEVDFANLPYWDLRVALRNLSKMGGWGLDEVKEKKMREGLRWFVRRAVEKVEMNARR